MKFLKFFWLMLRYRVAVMLILFFLLSIAVHRKITIFSFDYILAISALVAGYVSATTINDIVDRKIDEINHPKSVERLLVQKTATIRDLVVVHFIAVATALASSILLSKTAVLIVIISLFINYAYSLPPVRLSYRTFFAPMILSIAYVFIPYWLGIEASNSSFTQKDILFLPSLLFLFSGRIILKDLRDRKGDAKYGKPTFVLRFGKKATCTISFVSIILGNILLTIAVSRISLIVAFIMQVYFVAGYSMIYQLWQASTNKKEQTAIGIGAKMGNGLLTNLLGVLVLADYSAPLSMQIFFSGILALIHITNYLSLKKKPNYAVIGYKG